MALDLQLQGCKGFHPVSWNAATWIPRDVGSQLGKCAFAVLIWAWQVNHSHISGTWNSRTLTIIGRVTWVVIISCSQGRAPQAEGMARLIFIPTSRLFDGSSLYTLLWDHCAMACVSTGATLSDLQSDLFLTMSLEWVLEGLLLLGMSIWSFFAWCCFCNHVTAIGSAWLKTQVPTFPTWFHVLQFHPRMPSQVPWPIITREMTLGLTSVWWFDKLQRLYGSR